MIATPEGDQDVTAQQVRLLDSGACGAFVHGLEDEYQDVRNAAISTTHIHVLDQMINEGVRLDTQDTNCICHC